MKDFAERLSIGGIVLPPGRDHAACMEKLTQTRYACRNRKYSTGEDTAGVGHARPGTGMEDTRGSSAVHGRAQMRQL